MSDQTAVVTRPETGIEKVRNYLFSTEVKGGFAEMMGKDGIRYLNQVMTVVAGNTDLQQCTPMSILIAARRAAALKLSIDPSMGEAWIIAYNDRRNNRKEAQYQIGYKGVKELAMRTNKYVALNVADVYEDDELMEDRLTGNLTFVFKSSDGKLIPFMKAGHNARGRKVVGYLLYFALTNGFSKTFYMSKEEIADHAAHYAPGNYANPKSKWNDQVERPKMERKTVLMNGLKKYGVFNPGDKEILDAIESEQGFNENIPAESEEVDATATVIDADPVTTPKAEVKQVEGERPYSPEALQAAIENSVKNYLKHPELIAGDKYKETWRNTLIGTIEKELDVEDKTSIRKDITMYLVGKTESAEFTKEEVTALWKWLGVTKIDGVWTTNPMSVKEINSLYSASMQYAGQEEIPFS